MFKVKNTSDKAARFWDRNNEKLTHLAPGDTSEPVDIDPESPEFSAKDAVLKATPFTPKAEKPADESPATPATAPK